MTRNPRAPRPMSLDDESIALLIRDVAERWTMPAVRLDAPSWRERVRGRRARWLDAARDGFGRVGRAATGAVVLTVIAALTAVVITRPPQQPGGTPNPSASATDHAPAGASPLPRLVLNGELPFPSHILLANEGGDVALVDLGLGTISSSIARTQWPSSLSVTPDGLVVCICITTAAPVDGFPTRYDVRLRSFTRTTTPIRDEPVTVLVGAPDPRVPATHADHVWTATWYSPDGRYAFVGWSVRDAPVWHSGVLVVDIGAGSVVSEAAFPDMTAGEGDARRTVGAPRVLGLAPDGTIQLARSWAEWATANVDTQPIHVGDDAYQAWFADGTVSGVTPFPDAANCGPSFVRAGARPGGGLWVACLNQVGSLTVRLVAADGTILGSESMARTGFVDGDTTMVSADGRTFYAWDPGSSTLTRIDLSTGDRVDQRLDAGTASVDPMTALGRWIAPAIDAKSILRGAILASPDGSRLYLLGTRGVANAATPTGSAGVIVVDAASLAVLDRWAPAADFVSIALNADGSLLYAAGLPGVDAAGSPAAGQQASITVYDTATGAQRLVAGQLGMGMLSFPGPIVP